MDLEQRAKELIEKVEYLNIATADKNAVPWNTPVYAAPDEELNFYWSSWKEAEHSINIRNNPKTYCTLYDSTRKRGDNNRRCLYFSASSYEISEKEEVIKAINLLYPTELEQHEADDFLGSGLRRMYKAIPVSAWLNDISERQVTKETIKMRVEIDLERLKEIR